MSNFWRNKMKILYVGAKYDYGKPELGLSYEHYNFYDTFVKMNGGINEVIYFPLDEIMRKSGREKMNEELLEAVYKNKPDLVFFSNGGEEIKKEVIKEITQKSGAITLNWLYDDHWKFDKYSKYWAPLYSWVTTTDPLAIKKYHQIGYKNILNNPQGYNPLLYKPLNLPKIYDVSFVGRPHGDRKKVIKKIIKSGIDVKCWGEGWPAGHISQERMLEVFSQSKINLNLAKSSGIFWKEIASIFLSRKYDQSIRINNPEYWVDNFKSFLGTFRTQLKGRTFEIAGCGGFELSGWTDNLDQYYKIGKEIVCFYNTRDLIKKIKYYLEHNKEREAIAWAGHERTLRDHNYEKRFNEIFKAIGLI